MSNLLTKEERRAIGFELSNTQCDIATLERQIKKMKERRHEITKEEGNKVRRYMESYLHPQNVPTISNQDLNRWIDRFHQTISRTVEEFVNNI